MKVSKSKGSPYNDEDASPVIKVFWDVYMEPVETQGDIDGGSASIRLGFWKSCSLVEGQIYDLDLKIKPVIFKTVTVREA